MATAFCSPPPLDDATCGFCRRRNNGGYDPKVLSCGHIHCSKCLDKAWDSKTRRITCPRCKQTQYGSLYLLPRASISKPGSAYICSVCGKSSAASHCTDGRCNGAFRLQDEKVEQNLKFLKNAVEKRKRDLTSIMEESDRVLDSYNQETHKMRKLLQTTRDEQIRALNRKYEQLTKEVTKQRKVTEDEIVKYRDEVVQVELSHLNASLQRMDGRKSSDRSQNEISVVVNRELPRLSIKTGVGLKVKVGREDINADIATIPVQLTIGGSPIAGRQQETMDAATATTSGGTAGDEAATVDRNIRSRSLEVEEDFDKIYYEYMKIIKERELQQRVSEEYGGQVQEVSHPTDSRRIRIQIASNKPGEAAKMMDALNDLFYEINGSVHSHSTKLLYDGDKEKLAKALVNQFRDPKQGFIARLVTAEDIRIIGSLTNMDRDVSIVESFISDYKKKYPAPAVTMVTQPDIALPNGTVVTVMQGDLTKMKTDAVVSSSGPELLHKHGVSKAIANSCGQRFVSQGKRLIAPGEILRDGDAVSQRAEGRMSINGVRYIIHAIAPSPQKGKDIRPLLVLTIRNALKEAEALKCRTVALPAICSGIMGVDIQTCAECYWAALTKYSSRNPQPKVKQIFFVVDDPVAVFQIHEVMNSMSSGASGATAAHTGGSGSRQQGDPSRRGYTDKPEAMEVDDYSDRPSEQREQNFDYAGRKGTERAVAGPSTSSVGVETRQHGSSGRERHETASLSDAVSPSTNQYSSLGSTTSNTRASRYAEESSTAGVHRPNGSTGSAADTRGTSAAAGSSTPRDSECPICMDDIKDPIALPCSHKFCRACLDQMETTTKSHLCPTCRTPFRTAEGKQPKGGTMTTTTESYTPLPGYPTYGTIVITYNIPSGVQGSEHPNPGQRHHSTSRTAYLPNNTQGRKAERLLRKAFNQRMVFTIGQSVTTGRDNCVVWNDIHHKTNMSGGPSNYGYPDPDYLNRLIEDLQAKGITE